MGKAKWVVLCNLEVKQSFFQIQNFRGSLEGEAPGKGKKREATGDTNQSTPFPGLEGESKISNLAAPLKNLGEAGTC